MAPEPARSPLNKRSTKSTLGSTVDLYIKEVWGYYGFRVATTFGRRCPSNNTQKCGGHDHEHQRDGDWNEEGRARSLAGAGRPRPQRAGPWARHNDPGDRPADPVGKARRHHRSAAVDVDRLHAGPGRPDAARRCARGPLRPPPVAYGGAVGVWRLIGRRQPAVLGE